MKTLNYNETLQYGENVEVSINTYDGAGRINVSASCRSGERSTTLTLVYSLEDGSRTTEVSDFSSPYDSSFYAALDAKIVKVAEALSVEE